MLEATPIPTMRAFLESELTYVLPAPGGALADGGMGITGKDPNGDLYLAALAAKAKKRIGDKRTPLEYLQMHLQIVTDSPLFDDVTDEAIVKRVASWVLELAH